MSKIKISRALVSVSDKRNLEQLAKYFYRNKIEVLSSGGTYKYLKKLYPLLKLKKIEEHTSSKEILDGRVKTLHPKIHGAILSKNNKKHLSQLKKLKINPIELVVVNLYPFEDIYKKKGVKHEECIENIDIGGPTLIRGAAKNHQNVSILTSPDQYAPFIKEAESNKNYINLNYRKKLAKLGFQYTAYYDSLVANWMSKETDLLENHKTSIPLKKIQALRYGENPHQKASVYNFGNNSIEKISGKDLSYNNIFDMEIALELSTQFSVTNCTIVKHTNPCGVSLDNNQQQAYKNALKCDPVSAFGGVIAFNKKLETKTAKEIIKLFTEVVIAPSFDKTALDILSTKKNMIIIKYKNSKRNPMSIRSSNNFILIQEKDIKKITKKELSTKTITKASEKQINNLLFAFTVAKFVNSNAIVLANNLSTVGIGVGQTNRVDSAKQAIFKMDNNFNKINPVLASDGFFPFPDIIEICAKSNISAIIQPGGSLNDKLVIEAAEKNKIPLIFTGYRHFKH